MRLLILLGALLMSATAAAAQPKPEWTLVIHGGAGVIERGRLTAEQEKEIRAALQKSLDAGSAILKAGGASLDAVEAAVKVLEDDPHFNAGRGAVFTYDGVNELDAAIMDGRDRSAGAVAGATRTRNPIALAHAVMKHGQHVFLSGEGADQFSREQGLEQADASWFATPERRRQLEELKSRKVGYYDVDLKYGTVGAVALDKAGNVAAATSTGGLTGKRWGRIGDAPVIGAGTYADNRACAVSATGAGEYFIRVGVAHEICTRARLDRQHWVEATSMHPPLPAAEANYQAISDAVMAEVKQLGGTGGVIVVSPDGDALWSFNTPGMYRGKVSSAEPARVAIYGDDK